MQLLRLEALTDDQLLDQLVPHLIESDIKALREVLAGLRTRIRNGNRFQL